MRKMERKSMYVIIILSCTLILTSESKATSSVARQCCDEGVMVSPHLTACTNGKHYSINCDYFNIMNNDEDSIESFEIDNDGNLNAFNLGYKWEEPNFCIGRTAMYDHTIAVVCPDKREPSLSEKIKTLYTKMIVVLNVISALALAVTVVLYFFLSAVQDTQGNCMFHLSLVLCILHTGWSYFSIFDSAVIILKDRCITTMYMLIYIWLVVFMWMTIANYNLWIHCKSTVIFNEDRLMKNYRYIGYGFPAFIVVMCNLTAHATQLYTTYQFALECIHHQTIVIVISVFIPTLISVVANFIFFVDTQRRLWNLLARKFRSQKSTVKIVTSKLILNGKLFITTGATWSLFFFLSIICTLFLGFQISFINYVMSFLLMLISAEGVFIFLILVAFRKRVLKDIARQPFISGNRIFPERWKTMIDSETEVDSEADDINDSEVDRTNNGIETNLRC